jgi:hypothetical protein
MHFNVHYGNISLIEHRYLREEAMAVSPGSPGMNYDTDGD